MFLAPELYAHSEGTYAGSAALGIRTSESHTLSQSDLGEAPFFLNQELFARPRGAEGSTASRFAAPGEAAVMIAPTPPFLSNAAPEIQSLSRKESWFLLALPLNFPLFSYYVETNLKG
jgi:hypothetical protein